MGPLSQQQVSQIIEEINGSSETTRRAQSKKRHDIYKDGGKKFLLEQLRREFSDDALVEMRLAPINLLKKMVNRRSQVYSGGTIRTCPTPSDQELVNFYVKELALNEAMIKANRYFNLFSNVALYARPCDGEIKLDIIPPYLYSVVPKVYDRTEIETWIFSAFVKDVTPVQDIPAATSNEGYSREVGNKVSGDMVDSSEKPTEGNQVFLFWNEYEHFTTNSKGERMFDPTKDDTQFINPIGCSPIVNLAKDRDNEPWATQFEDAVDLTLAIMSGWTDLLTIAKHQGFSLLTIISEEEPKQLKVGVNKAIWLRRRPGEDKDPSISYVQANSPLAEYKELMMELLALLLSSNDMPPNSIGGKSTNQSYSSGFHALIEQSDILQAIEQDKPSLKDAELDLWEVISRWHNYMYDIGVLEKEFSDLGKFSDQFDVNIVYKDIRPLQSEQENIQTVKDLMALGLITREDAIKKLNPDMTEEDVAAKLEKIDTERSGMMQSITGPAAMDSTVDSTDDESKIEKTDDMMPVGG